MVERLDNGYLYYFHLVLDHDYKPGKKEEYQKMENADRLLQDLQSRTGGQVRTRFAPEPNGQLHIGHAKALCVNFGFAKENNGICYLRYDDTNPDKEDDIFVKGIQEMVEWLGFKPYKITHSSDYFHQLYELAEELIKIDHAYVCHQGVGEMWEVSPWRYRPTFDSIKEFRDMKRGLYKEGHAVLRLRMTGYGMDPVAYRIKHKKRHIRTGDEWCIYPTYDYAHCLCDTFENISHSFHTSEFTKRRSIYNFVLNSLGVYQPVQSPYRKLMLHQNVTSKRYIRELVEGGFVQGWDDPRLCTLAGLRRRGIPPEAINSFCMQFGLKTSSDFSNLKDLIRVAHKQLNYSAPRLMAVIKPLKIVITNYDEESFDITNVQHDPSKGRHTYDREIWIERTDFQKIGDKNFRGLTMNQGVGLLHINRVIYLKNIVFNFNGDINFLEVTSIPLKKVREMPKGFIHWVAKPVTAEARIYDNLFKSKRPDKIKPNPGFLSDVNPDSLKTSKILIGECSQKFVPLQQFHFERVGFFTVDADTRPNRLVFNQIKLPKLIKKNK